MQELVCQTSEKKPPLNLEHGRQSSTEVINYKQTFSDTGQGQCCSHTF